MVAVIKHTKKNNMLDIELESDMKSERDEKWEKEKKDMIQRIEIGIYPVITVTKAREALPIQEKVVKN